MTQNSLSHSTYHQYHTDMNRSPRLRLIELKKMPTGSSDQVLKKNITSIKDALKKITGLRPVTWNWKYDTTNQLHYGFVAQELETMFPHLISEDPQDAHKRLSTHDLIPYIIGATKEQQTYLQNNEAQINELLRIYRHQQRQIIELKERIASAEAKQKLN